MKSVRFYALLDAENINQPHALEDAIAQISATGTLAGGAAILPPGQPNQLRATLLGKPITILSRLPEMPPNAGDAMLACAALQQTVTPNSDITDFVVVSNDLGFGGLGALLRDKGYRCWRICTKAVAGSSAGFDGVVQLQPASEEAVLFPMDIFPDHQSAIDLAYFGNRLQRSYPDLKRYILRFGKHLAGALAKCAELHQWPIRVIGNQAVLQTHFLPASAKAF